VKGEREFSPAFSFPPFPFPVFFRYGLAIALGAARSAIAFVMVNYRINFGFMILELKSFSSKDLGCS
jgi:hypothetical protein